MAFCFNAYMFCTSFTRSLCPTHVPDCSVEFHSYRDEFHLTSTIAQWVENLTVKYSGDRCLLMLWYQIEEY